MYSDVAVLFPGQGRCDLAPLRRFLHRYPEAAEAFAEVDAAAPTSEATRTPRPLPLTLFAASIGVHRALERNGLNARVIVGHGFGEIAALVCAGALSVRDGFEIVRARTAVLERPDTSDARMAIVHGDPEPLTRVLARIGTEKVVVAAINSPREVVLAGRSAAIGRVKAVAHMFGVEFRGLTSRQSLHASALADRRRAEFLRLTAAVQPRTPDTHLLSATDPGEPVTGAAHLERLADSLLRPLRLPETVHQLRDHGIRVVIEVGALHGLGSRVADCLDDASEMPVLSATLEPATIGAVIGMLNVRPQRLRSAA